MLNNSQFFLKKSTDPYGLLKDKDFKSLLSKLIGPNHYNRPNVRDIKKSKFSLKWEPIYNKLASQNVALIGMDIQWPNLFFQDLVKWAQC